MSRTAFLLVLSQEQQGPRQEDGEGHYAN